MKRILVDDNLCQGARMCESIAAVAVEFDDDGVAKGSGAAVTDDVAERLELACPSMAITTIDV